MRQRVAVTGIGTISAGSWDVDGFVDTLRQGRQCFSELTDSRLRELNANHGGLIFGLEPNPDDPKDVRVLDRNVHLALRPLREAVQRARLEDRPLGPRAGVVFGTCSGGMLSIERHYEALANGVDALDTDLLFSKRYYTTAKVLAWAVGASGPVLTVVTACAAGAGAIAKGADLIRAGLADLVLAGGSDTFAPSTLAGFDALKATSATECTPFSNTIGLNLGEGAAFLVLESMDHAKQRSAEILAEILGYGTSNDAFHPTSPDPSSKGQVAAMERALIDAGADSDVVDYVNAHGTGTRANDAAESRAIGRMLKDRVNQVPVSSTKSQIGHCLGAAGALETAATVLAGRTGFMPSTAGFEGPREGCNLPDYVPDSGRNWQGRIALSNSFGFGGNNASLLIDVTPEPNLPATNLPESRKACAVISGLGLVTPLGLGVDPLIRDSSSGVSRLSRFSLPWEPFMAGLVPRIDPREVDRRLDLKGMDLSSQYAALAVRSALAHARLKPRPGPMTQVGMVLGLATGPSQGESDHLEAVFKSGFNLDSMGAFPYVVPNEVAGNVARSMLLKGHSTVLATGYGAGIAAVISAAIAIEQGHAGTIVAASADELSERTVTDGYRTGLWGPGTGVIPGEGAAACVIEADSSASQRQGPKLAEIVGYGLATDVDDPRRGGGLALSRALHSALDRSGVDSNEVDFVASGRHGSEIDFIEQQSLKQVFGIREVPLISFSDRIGFAEASLCLFNLSYLIATCDPGAIIAATYLSPEGFAGAIILKLPAG